MNPWLWLVWGLMLLWVSAAARWRPLLRLPYVLVQWFASALMFLFLIVLGFFFVVPLALKLKVNMAELPLWGNREEPVPPHGFLLKNRPFPVWWWFAIRNPVNNFRYMITEPKEVKSFYGKYDFSEDDPMEQAGWRWRYRHSMFLDSFRCTWGPARGSEGKREFYIGWKIASSTPGVGFAFSPRPFPLIWWTNLKQRIRGLFAS
jgi:hypothetical protein